MDISSTTNERMLELPWLKNYKTLDCTHIKYGQDLTLETIKIRISKINYKSDMFCILFQTTCFFKTGDNIPSPRDKTMFGKYLQYVCWNTGGLGTYILHNFSNFKNKDGGQKELFFVFNQKSRNANGCSWMVSLIWIVQHWVKKSISKYMYL